MSQQEPTVNVRWSEGVIESLDEMVTQALFMIDEQMEEEGWDHPPMLGVVHSNRLGSVVSMSLEVPGLNDELADGNFEDNVARLAAICFSAEVEGEEETQTFLNNGVRQGFQGWLFSAEFYVTPLDEEGQESEKVESRITMLIDIDGTKYGIGRIRGMEKAEVLESIPQFSLVRSLSVLVAASVMSIVRRDLDQED